jgi:hypothetical protein
MMIIRPRCLPAVYIRIFSSLTLFVLILVVLFAYSNLSKRITLQFHMPASYAQRSDHFFEDLAYTFDHNKIKKKNNNILFSLGMFTYTYERQDNTSCTQKTTEGSFGEICQSINNILVLKQESRRILMESVHLLRHEPPELPEGRLAQQARVNLIQMEELIRNLSASLPPPM